MNRSQRYPAADGLKGLLIFLIVLHNLIPALPSTQILDRIPLTSFIAIYGGSLGNGLFFTISGFLIATGYRERIRSRSIRFPEYLLKRLRKLYPIYLLTNLVMLVLSVLQYGPSGINLKRILFTIFLQLGGGLPMHPYNGPSWFLSALFLCYVLYFAVAYFAPNPTGYYLSLVGGILAGYGLLICDWQFSLLTPANGSAFLNFCIGCLMADACPALRPKLPRWLPGAALLTLAASFYLMLRYGVEIIAGDSSVAFYFLVCPLTLYLALDSRWISRLLTTRPVQALGSISLSVFFWHYPVFEAMKYGYSLFSRELTETHLPLYLIILILFCTLYSRAARSKISA